MRSTSPAAATVGIAALLWVTWELLRTVALRGVLLGVTNGPVLDLRGDAVGGSWWLEFAMPLGIALGLPIVAGTLGHTGLPTRIGYVLLGAGAVAIVFWTALVGLAGFSDWIGAWIAMPVFFHLDDPLSWWCAWGRWWFDLALLGALAALLSTGPITASARRALFALGLAVSVDSLWRAFVALGSGQIPMLAEATAGWGLLLDGIWILAGAFGIAFLGVFANLADRDGPPRGGILVVLAIGGVWLGLQGALLFTAGTLEALGFDGRLIFPMPLYDPELGALRLGLLLAGAMAVGLGLWREGR